MNHPKMKMKKGKLVTKQLLVAIDFDSTEQKYYESHWLWGVSKWWQDFHFWVNYPFKKHKQNLFS